MTACPEPVRLVAASAGEDVGALAHAAGCPGCRRVMRDQLAVRDVARGLPAPPLRPARRDAMAAELLARAEHIVVARPLPAAVIVEPWIRRAVATIAITAGALAAAAGILGVIDPPPPPASAPAALVPAPDPAPEAPATTVVHVTVPDPAPPEIEMPGQAATVAPAPARVAASDGARYDRRSDGALDRIALRDGTVTIETTAAAAPVVVSGTNVRVRTRNARLTARARAGLVQQVQVFAGSVEIHTGSGVVVVTAGETWSWDPPAPAAKPAPVAAFRAGWEALKAGQFVRAATELERAEGDRGVGEDATYWAAIAWGRAGEADKARAGLKRFLDRYPNGTRAGEAHLALARLLDDPAAVRLHLEAAADDADPKVRAAAKAALEP